MRRPLGTAALCGLLLAVPAAPAVADGLPVLGVDVGYAGVSVPGVDARMVAVPLSRGTLVARIGTPTGSIVASRIFRRRLTIPAVAYDATAGGLSADGRTLVLIRPRVGFPQRDTRLVVLSARHLRLRARVKLPGDYSFDAISPDGRSVFLIHYTSPRDWTRYEVRVLDVATRRLAPEPILDPHEPDEAMRGNPLSRTVSADGRWAYTLYDGAGGHPFIHALDTAGRTARCVDLPVLEGAPAAYRVRMAAGDRRVRVLTGGRSVLEVDTTTWAVRRSQRTPPTAAATRAHVRTAGSGGGVDARLIAGLAVLGLAVATIAAVRATPPRGGRSPAPPHGR
jgi:hypothetical protein